MVEVDNADFDVLFLCETWHAGSERTFRTTKQNNIFLNGGLRSKGVDICISRKRSHEIENIFVSHLFVDVRHVCNDRSLTTCETKEAVDDVGVANAFVTTCPTRQLL